MDEKWDATCGDHMNELLIIGIHLDKDLINAEVEACLYTEEEWLMAKSGYPFKDPFPEQNNFVLPFLEGRIKDTSFSQIFTPCPTHLFFVACCVYSCCACFFYYQSYQWHNQPLTFSSHP